MKLRMGGRVVECGSLENYFGAILQRGFESLPIRLRSQRIGCQGHLLARGDLIQRCKSSATLLDRWQSGLMLRFTKPPMVLEAIRGFESLSVRLVARSTTVVHPAVNGRVEGSNPSEPVDLWCKGSTGDFDSPCLGSNPGGSVRGVAQFGSAPALGAGGRRFKSCHPDS